MMIDNPHNCKNLLAAISDFVDGDLPADLCFELNKHLAECENCRIVVNTMRKTIELYQECEKEKCLPEDTRERLYKRLQLEDFIK